MTSKIIRLVCNERQSKSKYERSQTLSIKCSEQTGESFNQNVSEKQMIHME